MYLKLLYCLTFTIKGRTLLGFTFVYILYYCIIRCDYKFPLYFSTKNLFIHELPTDNSVYFQAFLCCHNIRDTNARYAPVGLPVQQKWNGTCAYIPVRNPTLVQNVAIASTRSPQWRVTIWRYMYSLQVLIWSLWGLQALVILRSNILTLCQEWGTHVAWNRHLWN